MEERIQRLEQEVSAIRERNARVEADKAWEVSLTRAVSIIVVTYVVATLALYGIGDGRPWISALIPTLGFFLSIQSLPFIKRWWLTRKDR
ncbi:MAG: hypothetical protein AAB440_01135 [Patescibacteria group bacterium]